MLAIYFNFNILEEDYYEIKKNFKWINRFSNYCINIYIWKVIMYMVR